MERFGSSKLRIGWISTALLLTGLVLGGVRPGEGGNLLVFGAAIPLSSFTMFVDPVAFFRGILSDAIYTFVPATLLLTAVFPAVRAVQEADYAGMFRTLLMALVNGLFYSQVLLLVVWAASYRLLGNPLPGALCLADLNASLLGVQLLLWAMALAALFRSNAGVALLLALALKGLGKYMAWGGEYLGDPDLFSIPPFLVKTMGLLGRLLPTGQVPSDPFAWTALPLSLGAPLVLLVLFKLLPGKTRKG
jgi:hypothetical protein